jgi:rhodanese-related sulfurtransferase
MSSLPIIPPYSVANKISTDNIQLVDVREKDEYAREHIKGAMSSPLSSWSEGVPCFTGDKTIVFLCRSGMRTNANCAKLADHVSGTAYILDGGLDNWKKQGFDTVRDTSAPLEVNRQVQMIAGGLVLTGAILGLTLHPFFIGLSAFVGADLFFAGASGWCGMAHLLRVMPWNRTATTS